MNSSLNHIYRVVWNATLGLWQVASEVARNSGKTQSEQRKTRRLKVGAAAVAGAFAGLASMAIPSVAFAQLPTGGQVVGGQASIVQSGNALNINQTTDRAAIDWQSFNVGQGNTVNFNQPSASSIALNRVLGSDVSVIQGAINANGQVFLVNQNGILFTPTAQVNVGGIVASTQSISTADFMAGKHTFSGNSTGTVENQGSITTSTGGTVAIIAAKIINTGTITAPQGTVGLAAGNTVTLDLGGPVKIQVTEGALHAEITQGGAILADGGHIYLTAKSAGNLTASVINHTGISRALSMASLTGEVHVTADVINHSGTVDVSGDIHGGAVTLTAGTITDSGTTRADGLETGGRIVQHATGDITQTAAATLSASGGDTGGHVELFAGHGGSWTGGEGGSSDGHGVYAGQIYATGRRLGGFIETSGATLALDENTLVINAGSSEGKAGTWLIDPKDFTIAATGGDITGAFLSNQLKTQTVEIRSSSGATEGNGDIHVNDSITGPTGQAGIDNLLLMYADRDININKQVNVTSMGLYAQRSVNVNDVVSLTELDLQYGGGSSALKPSDAGALNMGMNANGFTGRIDVGTGTNAGVTINGTTYTIIRTASELAAIPANSTGNYVLAADISLPSTNWSPISGFAGRFDGLGHKANNLTINNPQQLGPFSYFGLFGTLNGSVVTNLGVAGSITTTIRETTYAGGLAGYIFGSSPVLRNVFSAVNVDVTTGSSSSATAFAGGLVGRVEVNSSINNAYATGNVSATNTGAFGSAVSAGGLVGSVANPGASLNNVFATGNARAQAASGNAFAGGLIANANRLTLTNAYATGDISGATSVQSSEVRMGGLVGNISSTSNIGNVFASGKVSPLAASTGKLSAGGLIGSSIMVTTTFGNSSLSNAYWDVARSGQASAVGVVGTNPQLTQTNVNSVAIGTAGTTYSNLPTTAWGFNNGTPFLLAIPTVAVSTPVFIRLDCGLCESIYGETPQFSFKAFTAASGGTAVTDAMLTGTALYSLTNGGVAAGTELGRLTDAGTYAVTYTSGLTGSSMYELSAGAATNFTIKPKLLTVAIQAALGSPLSKVYDGNQNIALSANNFAISGFVDQQGVGASVSGVTSGTFNNANVAQANTITATLGQNSIVLPSTAKAGNYTLPTTASGAGTITPKALNITTNEFVSSATANAVIATTDGLVAGQTVSALNLEGKNLSVAFGENTLASNYSTTVVVPGAAGADLAVNRDLSLASGLNLTLRGDKNIVVNKVIDATTGTGGKVTLEFGQGAVAAGNTAEYVMNLVDTTFNGKINLLKGQNFATKQGSDGELLNYTVITELGEQGSTTGVDLQGMNGNVAGRYVLGGDIDATVTNTWNVNNQGVAQGFAPLVLVTGSGRNVTVTPFSGTFDGLGHAVSNLTINRSAVTTGFGLFGSSTGFIRHLGLSGGSVTGGNLTGALVGTQTGGSISHVYSTANVNGTSGNLGGLIGRLQNASVRHARSSGTVSSSGNSSVGGLIGSVSGASTVTHSRASGNVQASNGSLVGGLVGFVLGSSTLTDVSATGQVTGFNSTGGLIGSLDDSTLSRAFASGAVNGPVTATNSTNFYGGLVGTASNSIISDVFATGAVNAGALRDVGGLIGGLSGGSLTNGYATGAVMGMTNVGGLIGFTGNNATLSNSFWNTQTTGRDNAVGTGELSATSAGNAGKTTAQLQNAFTFIDAGWNFETVWGKSTLGANNGYMQLRNSSNDNFDDYVKVADSSKVYGAANSTITGAALSGVGVANVTASFGSAVGELSDAGEYLYSTENVLNVTNKVAGRTTFVDRSGKLTITPKVLTVALQAALNNPLSKVYDGNENLALSSGNFALSGFVGQQGVGATLGGVTSGTFNSKNVLQATTVSADLSKATFSATGEGFKASNYSLPTTPATATGTITAKSIAVTGLTAQNKIYDGNRNAVVTGTAVVDTSGVIQGDTVNVTGTVTGGLFADKDAGNDKAVSVSGLSLSGTDADNYAIAPANLKANISQKALTISGTTVANKDYNGNTNATVSVGTITGVVEGETLGTTTATGQFAGKDVVRNAQGAATAQNVTVAYTLANGENPAHKASNYTLASETKTATINPKVLTITGSKAANKTYDGNTAATVTAGTLSGLVQGETLGATTATGQFADKNAGAGKNVTVAYTLVDGVGSITAGAPIGGPGGTIGGAVPIVTPGAKASNYSLAGETLKADIAQKQVSITEFAASNKTYDGNTTATISNAGKLNGVLEGDAAKVALTNTGATFDTKDAGTGKTVTLNGKALTGDEAKNYVLASDSVTAKADIAQKQLTVTGFAAGNKTYDGNTTATISNAGTLNGVVQGDAGKVALNNTGATFDTKDAGTAKTVTLNGKTLSGDEAKNYVLATTPVTAQANIDRRALSIAGSVVANKTYDGNTAATVTAGTLSGLVQGETLGTTTATGQFADKNAGTGKNVTVAYTLVDGEKGQASNYSLAGETLKADIAQKQVNITEFAAANKVYDGNTTATISNAGKLNGVLEGDAAKVALTNTGATFDTKNVGTGKTVTLNGKALTGDEAKNYVLASDAVTAKADIAQKAITLTGFDAANKVYDGNTVAQIVSSGSLTGVVQNDTVMVSNSGATFDTKNAGTAKTVTLNGVQLSGTDAGNYSIANTATDTANIAQKQLTIAEFAASNKVYDGNTTATIANAGKLIGVVEGDTGKVVLGNTGATFDTKNAGTGKTVTLNGANITGTESANYLLAPTAVTAKADIAKKEITLAGFDAANKVYDGNTAAQIVSSGSLTGVVSNDTVMVSNSGATFDTKNAGTGKTVTLNGVALSGSDAGNYSIANTATDTADITQKAITLTGFDAANKVYDGNTVAQIVSSGSLTGVVTNDTVMVSNSGATFDTKNAGTAKTVTLNGVQLSGTDAANYSIANTATDTASITQKTITLTGFDAANKVYDGNTTAQIVSSGSLAGLVEKDTVMVSNSGATFDNRNAGTAKTVTLNGVVLSGTDAGNYSIANTATDTADITKRGGVVLTALNKEKQLGEADPALTFEVTGLVQGDSLTGSLSRVAGETPGFYAINRGTVDNPNYEISQFNAGQLQINQSLPQETIATVNTLSSPELRPSLGERPPLDQGGVPQSQAQDTPFLVTPAQANVGGPAQVLVIDGGINVNFAGTSASGSNNNSGNTSEQQ